MLRLTVPSPSIKKNTGYLSNFIFFSFNQLFPFNLIDNIMLTEKLYPHLAYSLTLTAREKIFLFSKFVNQSSKGNKF